MLVATAGHVDHGKTTLVQRLTGVDTDRLPEEKKRGVSIDLGFAYAELGGNERIGFIDVPGHEKFVRNMLAGVGSIDLALLVVAADDGPMPQTREHLAILSLLGIDQAVVVITRTDLVDSAQITSVTAQCTDLLSGTGLDGAPIYPVSSHTGDGLEALRTFLREQATVARQTNSKGRFRLAVDRQFTIAGSGLVVTGTVFSGQLDSSQAVTLMPAGQSIRVRGLRVQDQDAPRATAGDRCALNLNASDLGRQVVSRGDWLIGEPEGVSTQRIDVDLTLLPGETRPLKHWSPVHLHWATASTTGRIALLTESNLAPGETTLAQLVLDTPMFICAADRLVIRDQSAQRTIAGAVVIDPFGPARGRAQPGRISTLNAMRNLQAADAMQTMLQISEDGVEPDTVGQMFNLTPSELASQLASCDAVSVELNAGTRQASSRYVQKQQWPKIENAVINSLSLTHDERPDALGLHQHELIQQIRDTVKTSRPLALAAIGSAVAQGTVKRNGRFLHLAGHQPKLGDALRKQWERIAPHLSATTLRPPVVTDLAKTLDTDKTALQTVLLEAAERGLIVRFAPNRFFHAEAITRLANIVETLGSENPDGFDARQFRDASQIGRNLSIEVLEYFDTQRLTRRIGDKRLVIGESSLLFGPLPT